MINVIRELNGIPLWFFCFSALLALSCGLNTKKWILSLLIGYVLIILGETLFFRSPGNSGIKLTPFWSYETPELKAQIIANIILFIPLGILAGMLLGWKAIPLSTFFSFCIEAVQLVFHLGLFELDDIIHNTAGFVIGWLVVLITNKILRNKKGTSNVYKRRFNQTF